MDQRACDIRSRFRSAFFGHLRYVRAAVRLVPHSQPAPCRRNPRPVGRTSDPWPRGRRRIKEPSQPIGKKAEPYCDPATKFARSSVDPVRTHAGMPELLFSHILVAGTRKITQSNTWL